MWIGLEGFGLAIRLGTSNRRDWRQMLETKVYRDHENGAREVLLPSEYSQMYRTYDEGSGRWINPDLATCGTCGRTWDDGISTSVTPTPSGRCPFEYEHGEEVLERYGYVDTDSKAGMPDKVTFTASQVVEMRKWYNYYGNPSYTMRLDRGDRMETVYLVDDYGAENGLSHRAYRVDRRKDLFRGWL